MGNPRRTNGSKRDKLLRQVKRDEDHCYLCGQWVNVHLTYGLPASPEVDELVPVTYGGDPYDRSNCRLTHRYCNRLRWHGPIALAQEKLRASPPIFTAEGQRVASPLRPVVSREW